MAKTDPHVAAHLEWLGFIQPEGLVVSATALARAGAVLDRRDAEGQRLLRACASERRFGTDSEPRPYLSDFRTFAREVLGWSFSPKGYAGADGRPIPAELQLPLPDVGGVLQPDYAVAERDPGDGDAPWQLLVLVLDPGRDLDRAGTGAGRLDLTPHDRMQRMLRSAGVPAGLLFNGRTVRLVSAPRGESAGWMDFPVAAMLATAGRPLSAALRLLLSEQRLLALPRAQRLAALLADSRAWQNEVSERLAEQVLHALYELLRGFQAAHDGSDGTLLREPLADEPDEVYRALLFVVLRLVFLLYAEERNLLPADGAFRAHYSLAGLYERLREDAALYPDTMDQRVEAWPQLLALFRMVHDGAASGDMRLPARRGVLFDPDRFPFLEGRAGSGVRQIHERVEAPRVADGTVHRVLEKLLVLDGERISYRALDVEQIGSVYETMMGFRLETAVGRSAAIRSAKRHGAPATVNLDALLDQPTGARAKWLRDRTDRKLTDRVGRAVRAAATLQELHAALDAVIDARATPDLVPAGAMVLQPNAERRRSGSHYTPRALTEPIVRTALEPILARRRGDDAAPPRPEAILDLKVCDPAMGSGAFLVETCRQLAEALIEAWRAHGGAPPLEPDDDEVIVARRLVAQKCLYGVDRNPVAVDLAKMSLWLATLARDEPLTFIDHALRHGDSLVGLSRRQIEAFHWEGDAPDFQTGFEVMRVREHLERISVLRRRIRGADPSVPDRDVRYWWWQASREIDAVRLFGDLVVSAFFEGRKSKDRERRRVADAALLTAGEAESRRERMDDRRRADPPLAPFHWALEFPEVFEREASGEKDEGTPGVGDGPGFDAVVGNPPFAGKNTVAAANPAGYPDWLKALHEQSHGNADLVAHFFRRTFTLVREGGTFGLIATNTIAQGDTRSTGLRWICTHGGDVYHARRRLKWPGLAAVVVSVVHVCKGWFEGRAASTAPRHAPGRLGSDGGPAMPERRLVDAETGAPADQQRRPPCHAGSRRLDGVETDRITAFLFHRGGHEDPARLDANAGKSFQGSIVLGMGFTFDDSDTKGIASPLADARRLMADPRNREVIFPYIGGEEVNTSPTHAHHRYVINFRDYPLRREELGARWSGAEDGQRREWLRRGIVPLDCLDPVAADWPDLLAIVEERVKPGREVKNDQVARNKWWQLLRSRPELHAAIAGLKRVLAISRVGQQAALTFLPAGMVYADSTIVFPFSDYAAFCILQSRPHETWARFFASSMKDDLRYTPSDCFETFAFPEAWDTRADLEAAGRTCYEFRADLMVRRNEGLTTTYNRFHDPSENTPEVVTLRSLHAAMDRAVLDAYGWRDIPIDCEFLLDYAVDEDEPDSRKKPYRYRWPDAVRDEVLARLLELNTERAAEEARAGGAGVPPAAGSKTERPPSRPFAPGSGASRAAESRPLWGGSDE